MTPILLVGNFLSDRGEIEACVKICRLLFRLLDGQFQRYLVSPAAFSALGLSSHRVERTSLLHRRPCGCVQWSCLYLG